MSIATSITRRLEVAVVAVLVLSAALAVIYYDYIPGTLSFDHEGFPRGTGTRTFPYPSGQPRVTEKYVAGYLKRTSWFREDGSLVVETIWKQGSGPMYIVDDTGHIRAKIQHVYGKANGEALFYNADGSVRRRAHFVEGVERGTIK